jgi:SOS-response transcriptional repressor LexA
MPCDLTPRQLEVCRLIAEHRTRHGYSPTLEELAGSLGINKASVHGRIRACLAKGALLQSRQHAARSLSVADGVAVQEGAA